MPLAPLVFLSLVLGCATDRSPAGPLQLLDLEDRPFAPLDVPDDALSVFLFTRTDCPISNRYAPEVERLNAKFSPRGVVFWLVYPDPDEEGDAIRRHGEEFAYSLAALRDPEQALVRRTGATVTPEVAVFAGPQRLVYRGRIDDRYVAFGEARPQATQRDLEDVLDALLSGRHVEPTTTTAVGCFILDLE